MTYAFGGFDLWLSLLSSPSVAHRIASVTTQHTIDTGFVPLFACYIRLLSSSRSLAPYCFLIFQPRSFFDCSTGLLPFHSFLSIASLPLLGFISIRLVRFLYRGRFTVVVAAGNTGKYWNTALGDSRPSTSCLSLRPIRFDEFAKSTIAPIVRRLTISSLRIHL